MTVTTSKYQPQAPSKPIPASPKPSKATRRAEALSTFRKADDKATAASAELKAAKDTALELCDDKKTYEDSEGLSYFIDKETTSTDYSGTLKWALGSENPLNLTPAQRRTFQKRLDSSVAPKKQSKPIKRLS